jgi:Zinc finger, C3HC4 type (RING finger)
MPRSTRRTRSSSYQANETSSPARHTRSHSRAVSRSRSAPIESDTRSSDDSDAEESDELTEFERRRPVHVLLERYDFAGVDLEKLRELCTCRVCLDIITETTAVKECLHRFCKRCIETALRLTKRKECPNCRTHLASRRSLSRDHRFDAFIALVFPDTTRPADQRVSTPKAATLVNNLLKADTDDLKGTDNDNDNDHDHDHDHDNDNDTKTDDASNSTDNNHDNCNGGSADNGRPDSISKPYSIDTLSRHDDRDVVPTASRELMKSMRIAFNRQRLRRSHMFGARHVFTRHRRSSSTPKRKRRKRQSPRRTNRRRTMSSASVSMSKRSSCVDRPDENSGSKSVDTSSSDNGDEDQAADSDLEFEYASSSDESICSTTTVDREQFEQQLYDQDTNVGPPPTSQQAYTRIFCASRSDQISLCLAAFPSSTQPLPQIIRKFITAPQHITVSALTKFLSLKLKQESNLPDLRHSDIKIRLVRRTTDPYAESPGFEFVSDHLSMDTSIVTAVQAWPAAQSIGDFHSKYLQKFIREFPGIILWYSR